MNFRSFKIEFKHCRYCFCS